MTKKSGIEHVPNYLPTEVFDAGIIASNFPSAFGLSIRPVDKKLALGSVVNVGLNIPAVNLGVQSRVTKFERGQLLRMDSIEGGDADAYLEFVLQEESKQSGTEVWYEIEVESNKGGLFGRIARPAIAGFMASNTAPLIQTYRNNIIAHLNRQAEQAAHRTAG